MRVPATLTILNLPFYPFYNVVFDSTFFRVRHLITDNGDVFIFMSKNQRTVKMVNFEENAYYVHQKTFANGYKFMKLKFVEHKPVYSIDWKDLVAVLESPVIKQLLIK